MAETPVAPPAAPAAPPVAATPEPAPTKAPETPAQTAEIERRAAAIAKAKRAAAKTYAEAQALKQQRAEFERNQAEALRKAAAFDKLDKLSREDPLAYLKAADIEFTELSKKYLESATGVNKTPADLVRDEVDRRMAEEAKKREDSEKSAQEQRNKAAVEGAKRQMAEIAKNNKEKYELINENDAPRQIEKAWRLVEDWYAEKEQMLPFEEALEAVETQLEEHQVRLLDSKKIKAALERKRLQEAEANKKKPTQSSTRSAAVERPESQTPTPQRTTAGRKRPLDYRAAASELWAEHRSKLDN